MVEIITLISTTGEATCRTVVETKLEGVVRKQFITSQPRIHKDNLPADMFLYLINTFISLAVHNKTFQNYF